jgi:hypothetical protein
LFIASSSSDSDTGDVSTALSMCGASASPAAAAAAVALLLLLLLLPPASLRNSPKRRRFFGAGWFRAARAAVDGAAGAFVLAVLVNVVELLCTAGLPALYTSILSQQGYGILGRYGYLLLYILAYMFDDTLMVAGVVASLSRFKLQESGGRWLKLVSGSVVMLLGLVMLFRPEWLG